jgi:hypothetical protein
MLIFCEMWIAGIGRSSHDVYEINVCRVFHVSLSVRLIQLEKRWTYLDEIRNGYYATGGYPKILRYTFISIGNINMADERICEVESTLTPLL